MLKRGVRPAPQRTKKSNLGGIYGGKGFLLQARFQNAITSTRVSGDAQAVSEETFGTAVCEIRIVSPSNTNVSRKMNLCADGERGICGRSNACGSCRKAYDVHMGNAF